MLPGGPGWRGSAGLGDLGVGLSLGDPALEQRALGGGDEGEGLTRREVALAGLAGRVGVGGETFERGGLGRVYLAGVWIYVSVGGPARAPAGLDQGGPGRGAVRVGLSGLECGLLLLADRSCLAGRGAVSVEGVQKPAEAVAGAVFDDTATA